MSKKILDSLNEQIAIDQETIDVLPKNGIKALKTLLTTLENTKEKYETINEKMLKEIDKRYEQMIEVEHNERIKEDTAKLSSINEMIDIMDERSSFDKMDMDKLIYNVNGFYKKNLDTINRDIIEGIKRFENIGIQLTADDFIISEFAHEYMRVLLEETRNGQINSSIVKEKFEKLYWQCSDIISHIYVNLRYIYEQKEKEIDKFFENKKNVIEATKNINLKQLEDIRSKILNEKRKLENIDDKLILDNFYNKNLTVGNYKKDVYETTYRELMSTDVKQLSEEEQGMMDDNIQKLYDNLTEYSWFMQFKFLNDEVLKIREIEKKKQEKQDKDKKKKSEHEELSEQIKKLTDQIFKLNYKIANPEKKSFFKKELSDKEKETILLERNKTILEVKNLYIKMDEIKIREDIVANIGETSTLLDVLKFASYHYGFLARAIIKQNSEITDSEISDMISEIRDTLKNWDFAVINNVTIGENKELAIVIKDKYKLFGMNLSKDDFSELGLEDLIKKTKIIRDYNNLQKSNLTINRIDYIMQVRENLMK